MSFNFSFKQHFKVFRIIGSSLKCMFLMLLNIADPIKIALKNKLPNHGAPC